jgi:diguanylate cyclase (GGDEF)-like protein
VINFGRLVTHKFVNRYIILKFLIDISYTLAVLIVFDIIFDWYSGTPVWVLIIMGMVIFIIVFILDILNLDILNKKLETLSITDELTKLDNRRSFMNYFDIIWKQSSRLQLPIAVIMIDIDFFKKYNDSLGHLEGDKALIEVAQCIKKQLKRKTDFVARFGGEEFVCLLPYIEKTDAMNFAEELIQSIENLKIPHPQSNLSKYVTISAGMASMIPDDSNSPSQILHEADKAQYAVKHSGRNKVMVKCK